MEIQEENKTRIVFIINPFSGIRKRRKVENVIMSHLDFTKYAPEMAYTERPGHATEICREAIEKGAGMVVAVGGDGSVNEVAKALANTDIPLGIIPSGSGNGLAHHLHIPLSIRKAIHVLNRRHIITIDTATFGENLFFSVAGVGFDAHVAKRYSQVSRRGFFSYFGITIKEYRKYKPGNYRLMIDGRLIERRALFITFANSDQFGYRTVIAPDARADDGLLDVCIVSKIPFFKIFLLSPLLFLKKIHKTRYVEIFKAKEVHLVRKKGKSVNLDGEWIKSGKEIDIRVHPASLRVVVP
ncbi:MAG: diacylglycerol kinase family lipid kinase [Bacteroidetes bacterium]|nr:diacylglycerol kinase family lipid kinase [Bacteroidota bacterium]